MSESDKETGKLLRDKFKNFTPEPPSDMWSKIQLPLNQKSQGNSINYYKYAAAILLLLLPVSYYLGGLWYNNTKNQTEKNRTSVTTNESDIYEESYGNIRNSISRAKETHQPTVPKNSNVKRHIGFETSEQQNYTKDREIKSQKDIALSYYSPSESQFLRTNEDYGNISDGKSLSENTISQIMIPQATNESIHEQNESNYNYNEISPSIDSANNQVADKQLENQDKSKPRKVRWSVGLVGGPNISYRNMHSTVHSDLVNHRNEYESQRLTHNVALEFGLQYAKWIFTAGIAHLQKGETYSFKGTVNHEFNNKYDYVSVPVHVGRIVFQTKRFDIVPMVGFSVNRLLSAESSWLNPHNHSEVHMSSKQDNPFRETGYLVDAQMTVNIHLTAKWDLMLRGGYTYFLQSIYKPNMQLDHRPYSWDQNIGLRYSW